MKNKKKLIKRIGAVLCALVIALSTFGASGTYYANYNCLSFCEAINLDLPDGFYEAGFEYVVFSYQPSYVYVLKIGVGNGRVETKGSNTYYYRLSSECDVAIYHLSNNSWSFKTQEAGSFFLGTGHPYFLYTDTCVYYFNTDTVLEESGFCFADKMLSGVLSDSSNSFIDFTSAPNYNSALGYLQNVKRKGTYIRDDLYNYDDDSLTYHWYHDLSSTSGVDLSSGGYEIRHYISNATVKGYEKEDIIEMSDKYLVGQYDASQGYFSYLQKDYNDKLHDLGYEDLGFIDIYLKGYFTLQHHYFQIVNTSTNEVGGYLHIYPKDATNDNLGVEMMYEGTDLDGNVDEDAPNGYFDSTTGSGETLEDALENADMPKFDDLRGMEEFIGVLQAYGAEVENVSKGFGALLGEFPPWVLGVIGIGFGLLVLVGVIKSLG